MAIEGTGAIEREGSILMVMINGIWEPIGEDNESLERTRNNTVTQTKNVLGKTSSKVTKGNQITSVSPYLVHRDSALGKELYELDRTNAQLDELKYPFMEVSIFDVKGRDKFAAWTQDAKIDIKSVGGDSSTGLAIPFDIVWEGDRVYGVYDRAANTFTPDDGIGTLTVVSTPGDSAASTTLFVSPQLSTGNHYVYTGGSTAENVSEGDDLSDWDILAAGVSTDIADTPEIITVAEVSAANKAVKFGSVRAVYGS